jgi:3-hydroxyisobutyrate dehydrogenase-like beta-hydroxyacid dehydrogenase
MANSSADDAVTTTPTDKPRVGFIGLGKMGRPMALNLVAAGYETTVHNRSRATAEALGEKGARVADSPREVAASADIVITMLADEDAVASVFGGDDGVLAAARPGQVLVEMSTIGPVAARAFGEAVAATGAEMIDCPVSGSVPAATDGTLLGLIGGSDEAVQRVAPVLDVLCRARIQLGPLGSGAAMKVIVNAMIGVTNLAVSEGLVLAECLGIERETAYDVLASSAIASPFVQYKRDAFLDPDSAEVFFSVELMQRDLDLALTLARDVKTPLFAGAVASESLSLAAAAGFGRDDVNRVADVLRELRVGAADEEV